MAVVSISVLPLCCYCLRALSVVLVSHPRVLSLKRSHRMQQEVFCHQPGMQSDGFYIFDHTFNVVLKAAVGSWRASSYFVSRIDIVIKTLIYIFDTLLSIYLYFYNPFLKSILIRGLH